MVNCDGAVEAGKVLAAEIIQDGRAVGNAVSTAKDHFVADLISEPEARRHLLEVPVLERSPVDAGRATAQEDEGAGNVVSPRIRRGRIKPGLPIEGFLLGQRDFPTQPDVERELRGRLPVVLREEGEHSRAVARLRAVDRLARAVRAPENEAREGMTRRAREAGERGFRASESEGTRQVARLIGVVTVACELSPEL